MKHSFKRPAMILGLLAVTMGASACLTANLPYAMRVETARRLAMPTFMLNREIPANGYKLTAYERIRHKGAAATIYIEGDAARPNLGATPTNPVALHMATRDNGPNVIYLARPCQYTEKLDDTEECAESEWNQGRYSQTQLDTLNAALEDIRIRYSITGFNLIGYEGGGAMATLLAAQRKDVLSIRTVAGVLDTEQYARDREWKEENALTAPLNPVNIASSIATIPQNHFTGLLDDKATIVYYDAFRAAAGPSTCMRNTVIGKTDHATGWVNKWPVLLSGSPVDCQKFD